MDYKIDVGFYDDASDVGQIRTYYRALEKYDAKGIGHEKTRTSTMFLSSDKPLNIRQLTKDLEDIKILSVRKVA